ncbi:hypothetical protein H7B90_23735 [Cohnella xylanilytica]|uniref:Uncharacterized protein n=1 Tax=Cohnella xylanilytica TaxID=557555 RepID=A0A841U825_9BACL|nr:hypothetical protein [Cohnella xylanilytica]MBB6694413.1 hypothetical protein [Cohnella xylanilytica]
MSKITEVHVVDFNDQMMRKGSSYRIFKTPYNDYSFEINYPVDVFEKDRPMIYPNTEFYSILVGFFITKGIQITFNNTGSTFWTNDQ